MKRRGELCLDTGTRSAKEDALLTMFKADCYADRWQSAADAYKTFPRGLQRAAWQWCILKFRSQLQPYLIP